MAPVDRGSNRPRPGSFGPLGAWGLALLAGAWLGVLLWQSALHFPFSLNQLSPLFNWTRFGAFDPARALTHWLTTLQNLLLLLGAVLAAFGPGSWLLARVFPAGRSRLERLLWALGLGFIILALLSFLNGWAGLYRTVWLTLQLLGLAGWGAWEAWTRRAELRPGRGWFLGSWNVADAVLVAGMGAFGVLALVAVNTPTLFYDALVYHLAVPSQWVQAGRIYPMPFNFLSNLCLFMESLYALALQFSDERLCRLLHLLMGGLAGLTLFHLGRRWFGRRVGLWAAGLYVTLPVFFMVWTDPGVDLTASWYTLLSISVVLPWVLGPRTEGAANDRTALLAGLFAGAAVITKYLSALTLGPLFLIALGLLWHQAPQKEIPFRPLLWMLLGGLVVGLPWLLKNWVYTGNPVYPFFYDHIPSRFIHLQKMTKVMDELREYGTRTWVQLLRLPWDLSFYYPTSNSYAGPVFLFLLPGLLGLPFRWSKLAPVVRVLGLVALAAGLLWASATQIMRYMLPCFTLVSLLGAWWLGEQERLVPQLGKVVRFGVLCFMAWGVINTATITTYAWDPIGAGLGLESKRSYLSRQMLTTYYSMAESVNALPANTRVLLVGDSRSYYYRHPVTAATVFDHQPFIEQLDQAAGARGVWEWLKGEGFTHVVLMEQEAARTRGYEPYRWSEAAVRRLQELRSRGLTPLQSQGQQVLFAVNPAYLPDRPVVPNRPLFTYDPEVVAQVARLMKPAYQALRQQRDLDALVQYQQMVKLVPDWDMPYAQMGWLLLRLDRNSEAIQAFLQADRLQPQAPELYAQVGVAYVKLAQGRQAERWFQRALQQDPTCELAQNGLTFLRSHPEAWGGRTIGRATP